MELNKLANAYIRRHRFRSNRPSNNDNKDSKKRASPFLFSLIANQLSAQPRNLRSLTVTPSVILHFSAGIRQSAPRLLTATISAFSLSIFSLPRPTPTNHIYVRLSVSPQKPFSLVPSYLIVEQIFESKVVLFSFMTKSVTISEINYRKLRLILFLVSFPILPFKKFIKASDTSKRRPHSNFTSYEVLLLWWKGVSWGKKCFRISRIYTYCR